MATKKYYIRARVTASYSGILREDKSSSRMKVSELRDLLNTEVSGLKRIEGYERRYQVVGDEYIYFKNLYGVVTRNGKNYYRTNLEDVYINDIRLSERGKDGQYIFGKLEGTVTATIEQPIQETVLPGVLEYERNAETGRMPYVNNTSGQLTPIDNRKHIVQNKTSSSDALIRRRYFDWPTLLKSLFGFLILFFVLLALRKVLLPLLGIVAVLLLIGFLAGGFRKLIGFIVIGLWLLGLLGWIYQSLSASSAGEHRYKVADESSEKTEIRRDERKPGSKDSIMVVHHRVWRDYAGHQYEGDLRVNQSDYFGSKAFHTSMQEKNFSSELMFWRDIYQRLSAFDASRLSYVYALFDSIGKANRLSRSGFASMVVSCVQDIPYALISNLDCERYKLENPRDIPIINQTSCYGPVRYGVHSPTEFLYTLKGDCDTRTLLCYTLLVHYGYDVAILNSTPYRHSVLGVSMPASGSYKTYRGKPYYLWETTAKNCVPGFMAPDFNNLDYWEFALVSN